MTIVLDLATLLKIQFGIAAVVILAIGGFYLWTKK